MESFSNRLSNRQFKKNHELLVKLLPKASALTERLRAIMEMLISKGIYSLITISRVFALPKGVWRMLELIANLFKGFF
ncbi:hypothetical protein A3L08_00790 [Thermococcus pacificus]|uniref:Transposase n=1 Tax=Thermococcus pacificus TaxID=71998 RepID=A0A218P5D7_9EURY|nr:hypothetical protein A3L08_00790 [Thermococcus pacificus]